MNESQQLRESMWDLVYGLVAPEEEQQLIDRIKSDPHAARLYAEVRLEADLVSQAAKVEDSSVVFSGAGAGRTAATGPEPKPPVSLPARKAAASASVTPLVMAGLASALLVLVAVGLLWPLRSATQVARNFVAIDILSDPALPAGLTRQVELRTYAVSAGGDFTPEEAEVELRLAAADGRELLRRSVKTDREGQASVELPGNAIEPGTRVEVSSTAGEMAESLAVSGNKTTVAAELPVQPEPQVAYFLVSEPMVEEGKPVEVSLWNFAAFSAKPAPAEAARAAIEEVEGLRLQEAEESATQPGVLNALVQVEQQRAEPAQAKETLEELRRVPDASPTRQRVGAAPSVTSGARPGAGAAGTDPQAGMRLRQYAQGFDRNLQRRGIGQNRLGTVPQQQIGGGFGAAQAAIGDTELTAVAAGQPIQVPLPAALAGKEVIVTATCHGATVATTVHHPASTLTNQIGKLEKAQASSPEIMLDLPPEADGLIEVSIYERTSQEPVLVEQRQVYRQPLKQLQIEVAKGKARFAPGEQVDLSLRVTDEAGRPAANTRLGVRVWNEMSVQQTEQQPVLLADAVRSGSLAIAPEQGQQAALPRSGDYDFQRGAGSAAYRQRGLPYGNAQPADEAAAAEAKAVAGKDVEFADQIRPGPTKLARADGDKSARDEGESLALAEQTQSLGERAAEPIAESAFASQPIELASNRAAIQQAVRSATERAEERQRKLRAAIGLIVVVGGLALLVAVGASALKRMATTPRLLPAGAIGLVCLLIGSVWTGQALVTQREGVLATAQGATKSAETVTFAPRAEELAKVTAPPPPASAPANPTAATPADAPAEPAEPAPTTVNSPRADASGLALDDSRRAQDKASLPEATPLTAGGARGSGGALATAGTEPARQRATTPARSPELATQESAGQATAAPATSLGNAGRAAIVGRAAAESGAKNEQAAPSAIYFNPQLVTDSDGRASIHLVMPQVESEYRVLIDALGQGRVGSQQDQLIIDSALAKPAAQAK